MASNIKQLGVFDYFELRDADQAMRYHPKTFFGENHATVRSVKPFEFNITVDTKHVTPEKLGKWMEVVGHTQIEEPTNAKSRNKRINIKRQPEAD